MKKTKEISELSIEEIEKKLRDSREEMLNMRLRKQAGQIEKTHEMSEKRRMIARCETILAGKKRAAN